MNRALKMFCIALLSIAGLVSASVPARADRDDRCEKRIHQAEQKLRKAVDRHGENSRQAQKRREELERARRGCGDRRDHDRDRDHDHDQH
jgi:hypothetical protein